MLVFPVFRRPQSGVNILKKIMFSISGFRSFIPLVLLLLFLAVATGCAAFLEDYTYQPVSSGAFGSSNSGY